MADYIYTVWVDLSSVTPAKPYGMTPDTYAHYPCANRVVTSAVWVIQRTVTAGGTVPASNQAVIQTVKRPGVTGSVAHTVTGDSVPFGFVGTYTDRVPLSTEQLDDVFDSTELGTGGDWTPSIGVSYLLLPDAISHNDPNIETLSLSIEATFSLPDNFMFPWADNSCHSSADSTIDPPIFPYSVPPPGGSPPEYPFEDDTQTPSTYGYYPSTWTHGATEQFDTALNAMYWSVTDGAAPTPAGFIPATVGYINAFPTQQIPPFTFAADGVTPSAPWDGIPGYAPAPPFGLDVYPQQYASYAPFPAIDYASQIAHSAANGFVAPLPPKKVTVIGTYTDADGVPLQRQRVSLTYTTQALTLGGGPYTWTTWTRSDCYGNFAFPPIHEAIVSMSVGTDPLFCAGCSITTTPPLPFVGTAGTIDPPIQMLGGGTVAAAPVMPDTISFSIVQERDHVKVCYLFRKPGVTDFAAMFYAITHQSANFASTCKPGLEAVITDATGFGVLKTIDPNVIQYMDYAGYTPVLADFDNPGLLIPLGFNPFLQDCWTEGIQYDTNRTIRLFSFGSLPSCDEVLYYIDPIPLLPHKPPNAANGTGPGVSLAWNRHTPAGYYLCREFEDGSIGVLSLWHPDSTTGPMTDINTGLTAETIIDQDPTCKNARIAVQPYTGMVSVVYSKDQQDSLPAIFEQYSWDYGRTWRIRGPLVTGPNGVKTSRLVFYGHAGGKLLVYNDQSDLDKDNVPTGKGRLQVLHFDGMDAQTGPYPEDGNGIGNLVSDDASFEAIYVQDASSWIDCAFVSAQTRYVYRSYDNGQTWSKVVALSGDSGS